jgi:hypothetical protein
VVANYRMEHSLPFILEWDENLDVGSDTGTPVDVLGLQNSKSDERRV